METSNITLATLETATAQEVFDQVATHLLKQNKRSNSIQGSCRYRGVDNSKCAAGCLISDEEYTKEMEQLYWGDLIRLGYVKTKNNLQLIKDLQDIHDQGVISEWRNELIRLAEIYKLNTNVIL